MVCFVFDIWYRMATLYGPSDFINVSSIIFIVNILLLVAGVAYYAFKSWSKKGDFIFHFLFIRFRNLHMENRRNSKVFRFTV